jgi:hypothetical protein
MNTKHLSITCIALALTFSVNAQDPFGNLGTSRSTAKTTSRISTTNGKTEGEVTVIVNKDGNVKTHTWKLGENPAPAAIGMAATRQKEKVTWLGIAMTQVSDDVATQLPIPKGAGLRVRHILPKSPASKTELAADDLLYMLDDQILFNELQVQGLIRSKKPGSPVKLTYFRKGEKRTTTAKLSENEMFVGAATKTTPRPSDSAAARVIDGKRFRAILSGHQAGLGAPPSGPRTKAVVVDPFGQARVMEHRNFNEQMTKQLNSVRQQLRQQLEKSGMAKKEWEKALKSWDEAMKKANPSSAGSRKSKPKADPF